MHGLGRLELHKGPRHSRQDGFIRRLESNAKASGSDGQCGVARESVSLQHWIRREGQSRDKELCYCSGVSQIVLTSDMTWRPLTPSVPFLAAWHGSGESGPSMIDSSLGIIEIGSPPEPPPEAARLSSCRQETA